MSESNRVAVRYVEESTYGVTPADSANWQAIRFTSEALSGTPNTSTSSEIRSDRMIADQIKTGLSVGGDISFELSSGTFDDLLEAVMCDTWTNNTLNIGTNDKSFTIEKHMEDIDKYITFTGMRTSSMELSFTYGEMVTGKFSFMGNGVDTPGASLVGAGNINNPTTSGVLNSSSNVTNIQIQLGGVEVPGVFVKSISLTVDNQHRPVEAIGLDAPVDVNKGTANITGSIEAYLSAASFDLYANVLNQSDVILSWTVSDGASSYTFTLPRVKLSGEAPQSGGLDQDVMISVDFAALIDTGTSTSLRIVRS